jgi:hypothetical protein
VGLSNQGLLQDSIRGVTSTTHVFNGDWLALFALSNITTGTWDERCLAWINVEMSASYTNLADAQHAYAVSQGFDRWSDMSGLAPNVEQDTGNQTTTAATSDTATFTNATVTGRGVIVVFALKSGRRVSTLVDNKSNTYTRVGFAVDNSDAVVEMWYAQNITGGSNHIITVTYDGSANCVWGAIEVSRVKGGGGFLDANSVATVTRGGSGSSASVTVTSGTLRDNNELVVAMLSLAGGGANAGIDTPTGYTAITQFNDYDGIHAGHGAHRIAASRAAQSATWTNDTTTAPYAAIIAAFRAVGAVSVSGTAPANTVVPAITGTTTDGQTLTSSTGTWSGTVVSYTYQWKADGVNISGATASTYVLTSSEVGADITVAVTATNEVGSTTATSAAVGPVVSSGVAGLITPQPALALSTHRKLVGAYAGNILEVMRSSDNTFTNIGFSGSDVDTSAITTFVGANNGFLRRLFDQSGAGLQVNNGTAGLQPQIVSSGTPITTINSKLSAQFDGTDDQLISTVALSSLITASAYTVFAVARPTAGTAAVAGYQADTIFTDSAGRIWGGLTDSTARFHGGHYDGATQDGAQVSLTSYPKLGVFAMRYNGTTIRASVNGGTEATDAAGNIDSLAGTFKLGAVFSNTAGRFLTVTRT